ncbi:ATP-grasp domain-containing protein [Paraliomyxa miuraensis]|uniref:ATP-grasp domain-containing protein n=1 Tax=Paraliomyxa miuraensis TaxID=376150 RepID=UPI00225B80A5|nr:ATP-grasp domain-containing protein [Paraliomyxa miuraensis]MCX4248031.1 ATP-grasp domain-containing protein [Paraliomyxa miuraensis]
MKVLFLSPHYPEEMLDFTRGLAEVGAKVYGVGDMPVEALPARVRPYLHDYVRLPNFMDEGHAVGPLVDIARKIGADRVETLWEPLVLLAARVRDELGMPGMSRHTVLGFRDKPIMKARLVAAGVRVPRFGRADSVAGVLQAAREIGYPVVLKPVAGAGSADTWRVDDEDQARAKLATMGHVPEVSIEEFIEGTEFTYDAVAVEGEPVFESVTQYHPPPIQGRSQEWISPAQITLRDPYIPATQVGIALGRQVLQTLKMGTGFAHMEWFKNRRGEAVFSEIACRSGGGRLMDAINFANDIDVYREWARAVCWHAFEATPQRKYHVAAVFKRAQGQGRITRIEGLDRVRQRCGPGLVVEDLLPVGHPRRNWKQTLIGDGYVMMRSVDYRDVCEMRDTAVNALRIHAG